VPMMFLPFPALCIKGASVYTEEANRAGYELRLGQNIGLARLVYIGKTRAEAMQRARDGSIFLFSRFHAKFDKNIPTSIEPLIDAGVAFVGTVDDIRQQLMTVREKFDPDWFMILSDQGFLPLEVMKEQMEMFGKIMPELR